MELMEAIKTRRSVRSYKPDAVDRQSIDRLLDAAVHAPSGMNIQPWAFGVIQDTETLKDYSERIKAFLLGNVDAMPWLAQYQDFFNAPNYHVFYNAPTLIVIYAKATNPISQIDCTLAAENLMLAACDMGMGTCWIGFANDFLNQAEIKRELGVPEEYSVVAPIIVGYPDGPIPPRERNAAEVIYWK